jgi:hypothetical protein
MTREIRRRPYCALDPRGLALQGRYRHHRLELSRSISGQFQRNYTTFQRFLQLLSPNCLGAIFEAERAWLLQSLSMLLFFCLGQEAHVLASASLQGISFRCICLYKKLLDTSIQFCRCLFNVSSKRKAQKTITVYHFEGILLIQYTSRPLCFIPSLRRTGGSLVALVRTQAEIGQHFRLRCEGHDGYYISGLELRYTGNLLSLGKLGPFLEWSNIAAEDTSVRGVVALACCCGAAHLQGSNHRLTAIDCGRFSMATIIWSLGSQLWMQKDALVRPTYRGVYSKSWRLWCGRWSSEIFALSRDTVLFYVIQDTFLPNYRR